MGGSGSRGQTSTYQEWAKIRKLKWKTLQYTRVFRLASDLQGRGNECRLHRGAWKGGAWTCIKTTHVFNLSLALEQE